MSSNRLEWDKPMTSAQAARHHMTRGFVADELYDHDTAALRDENERLKRRLEAYSGLALCGDDIVCKQCGRIIAQGGNSKHVMHGTTDEQEGIEG